MANVDPGSFTSFGELLRYLRRRARLTQRELGVAVGYSDAQITRLEGGQRTPDPTAVRARFFEALDLREEPILGQRLLELAEQAEDTSATATQPQDEVKNVPAPTSPAAPTNLPAQLTRFIGRERDIAEVQRLVMSSRLLTLTGAGGVGKTRLALEVGAARAAAAFPDGVWLAELAAVSEPGLVASVVARTYGLVSASRSAQEIVTDHLRDKRLLLILDNCEHLIARCAELAEALLRACPGLHILATSREGLNVPGEVTWRVPSLMPGEAAQLFEERARAANPKFRIIEQNAATVGRVCERLDDIPLAIELAAARVRSFTPEQIEGRLDDAFRLLASGSRTALPRQQTLRGAIDWSYGLLTGPERVLFCRLAVFAGGWTLAAAEAVASDVVTESDPLPAAGDDTRLRVADVPVLLDQLVSKSLVSADEGAAPDGSAVHGSEPRYRMLEVVRQYAREKLVQSGEVERLRDRHLAHLCALTDEGSSELPPPPFHNRCDQIQDEIGNVRAALEWALQSGNKAAGVRLVHNLAYFWHERGYALEGLHWATAILPDEHTASDPRAAVHAHLILGDLEFDRGDTKQALQHAYAALTLAEQAGDYVVLARALSSLVAATPDESQAYALADRLLRIAHIAHERERMTITASVDYNLARRARLAGNFTEASRRLRAAEAAERALGNMDMLGAVLGESAFVAADQGNLDASRALWEQALAIFRQAHNLIRCAHVLVELGAIVVRQGDAAAALPMAKECLDTFHRLGNLDRVGESVAVAAGVAYLRGGAGHAATLLGAAEALWSRTGQLAQYRNDARAEYERLLPLVRAALPPDEFERAWAEGQRMALDQVIADVMAL